MQIKFCVLLVAVGNVWLAASHYCTRWDRRISLRYRWAHPPGARLRSACCIRTMSARMRGTSWNSTPGKDKNCKMFTLHLHKNGNTSHKYICIFRHISYKLLWINFHTYLFLYFIKKHYGNWNVIFQEIESFPCKKRMKNQARFKPPQINEPKRIVTYQFVMMNISPSDKSPPPTAACYFLNSIEN